MKHVFPRLKKIKNTVDMYYSLDGKKWQKTENSIEVSGFNHNTFCGFLGPRTGLCAIGDGSVYLKTLGIRS